MLRTGWTLNPRRVYPPVSASYLGSPKKTNGTARRKVECTIGAALRTSPLRLLCASYNDVKHHSFRSWLRGSTIVASRGGSDTHAPMAPPTLTPPGPTQHAIETLDSPVTLSEDTVFPVPDFAKGRLDARKRWMPQNIAHRGYKAKYPENSMLGFDEAVKAGATGLETDVHITKDGVVVLSHDATLKRCFGRKENVLDRTWDEIKDLRTLAPPHVPMARLQDLLEYLCQPGLEDVWCLLDIKLDNDAEDIMRLIGSTIAKTRALPNKPWNQRILLGMWAAKHLAPAKTFLPGFSGIHIGYKMSYARNFLDVEFVAFNMLIHMLLAPGGKRFIRECKEKQRQLIAWTVNDKWRMEWCIRRKFDGIITDDPVLFKKTCEEFDEYAREPWMPISWTAVYQTLRMWIFVNCLHWWYRRAKLDKPLIRRSRQ